MAVVGLKVLVAALGIHTASAQSRKEVIWSSVIVSTFGDKVPFASNNLSVLTPLGANQMYAAGGFFRARYIIDAAGLSNVSGISQLQIEPGQTRAMSVDDPHIAQSAEAFMIGLYPPTTNISSPSAVLANGSTVSTPLGGLQYPFIESLSSTDPNHPYLNAQQGCSAYTSQELSTYINTPSFQSTQNATQSRYDKLKALFTDVTPDSVLGYSQAYSVWDYFNYAKVHNATVAQQLSDDDLAWLRSNANQYVGSTLGNTSNSIMSISGRALSQQILGSLILNVNTNGTESKLSPLFTSWEPLMSLMYLLGLPSNYPDLSTVPNPGSSLVVEMYSDFSSSNGSLLSNPLPFPYSTDDLYVRLLFRNGSSDNSSLKGYTMGTVQGGAQGGVSLKAFFNQMASWQMGSPTTWCMVCGTDSAFFCNGLSRNLYPGGDGSGAPGSGSMSSRLSPALAGVVGALVALAVVGLVTLLVMLFGGFRLRKDRPSVAAGKGLFAARGHRKTESGGFKGAERMASDVDLPGAIAPEGSSRVPVHKRTSSWELRSGQPNRQDLHTDSTIERGSTPGISSHAGLHTIQDDEEDMRGLEPVEARESV